MTMVNMNNALGQISEVVQMVNVGDTTFNKPYGTARLIIEPGQSYMGQREVAAHFLGRWWTDNSDPKYRERVEDLRRLHTLYGAYEDEELWERNKPRMELYSASGERIYTLIDDPDGLLAKPNAILTNTSLEQQLAIMQRQMAQIQQAISNREGMPPQMDASMPPPPPPPHTPGPATTTVPGFPGAVALAPQRPPVTPAAPTPAPAPVQAPVQAEGGAVEFSEEYLRDLQSTMPAENPEADDILAEEVGTRIPVDARVVEETRNAPGVPVDSPPIVKTGPGASAPVRARQA